MKEGGGGREARMKEGGGGREARKKKRCEIRKKGKTVVDRPEKACVHAGFRLGYTFLRGLDCHSLQRTGPVACTLTQCEWGPIDTCSL